MRSRTSSSRSSSSCTCCTDSQLRRGPWTAEEDGLLLRHMKLHGDRGNWRKVPKAAGLLRCGKSCRLRWLNYLRPDLKRGGFSEDEDDLIIRLHRLLGNRWSLIAGRIPGRSDNEIKNYWNFHLGKKLLKMGINPKTHRPISDSPVTKENIPKRSSTFCHSNSFSSISSSVTSCDEDQSWASMDSKPDIQDHKNTQEYEVFNTDEFISNWSKAHGIHPNNPIPQNPVPQNPDSTDGYMIDHCTGQEQAQEGGFSTFTLDEIDNMMGYWQHVSDDGMTVPSTERACVDFWS